MDGYMIQKYKTEVDSENVKWILSRHLWYAIEGCVKKNILVGFLRLRNFPFHEFN
jgi:hypothetical protein